MKQKKEFWVINTSKMNVSLADLALTIPAGRAYNLLDSKHFRYTEEQLERSLTQGSLFNKRDKVKLGKGRLASKERTKLELSTIPINRPKRSAIVVEDVQYEELVTSDEKFADDFSGDLLWDPNKK